MPEINTSPTDNTAPPDQPGVLCVVLARGGSKGLPFKNGLTLAGRPMLEWTFDHALGSQRVDRVVLTTDCDALARVATDRGIDIIDRPQALANDTAPIDAAARHAAQTIDPHATQYPHVAILYGNVPVRPPDLTDRALTLLIDSGCDSVQSVYRVGKTHPLWMRTVDPDTGRLDKYQPNNIYRRQDLPPVYMLDGGVIAVTRQSLANVDPDNPHAFLGSDHRAVVTPEGAVVDIDAATDLHVAEATLKHSPLKHKVA